MQTSNTDASGVKREAKNTVFLDLFSLPEYSLQMVQALHPEMTDLTEADIKTVTMNAVILNGQYNDLALLVKDKLMIFVEAQATWSINILMRILLYLASTYYEYIIDNGMSVHSYKQLDIPEPEFYVIYTGSRKITHEVISLREDFWNNPNAKIDLQVRVIHAENKSDVIGQYIIFCHVLDEQIKIYGRKKKAAEETIRICQDVEVLKAYLEGRKKEVIGIMMLLFDQDYAMEVYSREREKIAEQRGEKRGEKRGAIKGTVETLQDIGISINEVVQKLATKFSLHHAEASKYVNEFWRK